MWRWVGAGGFLGYWFCWKLGVELGEAGEGIKLRWVGQCVGGKP